MLFFCQETWKSDILSLKEKQSTANPAFAFQGELTNKHFCVAESKALQERVCESECLQKSRKEVILCILFFLIHTIHFQSKLLVKSFFCLFVSDAFFLLCFFIRTIPKRLFTRKVLPTGNWLLRSKKRSPVYRIVKIPISHTTICVIFVYFIMIFTVISNPVNLL